MNIELRLLDKSEEEIFIRENQAAFDLAAIEEFGPQKKSVIDRKTIEECLHGKFAEAFRIIADGKAAGGVDATGSSRRYPSGHPGAMS